MTQSACLRDGPPEFVIESASLIRTKFREEMPIVDPVRFEDYQRAYSDQLSLEEENFDV